MNALSLTFTFKIALTILFWCAPLLLFPASLLEALGFPEQPTYLFVRLLGWAYVALCVGYGFGLRASLEGTRAAGPIWAGIVSNGGACAILCIFGIAGAWSTWSVLAQVLVWSSAVATGLITLSLLRFGAIAND